MDKIPTIEDVLKKHLECNPEKVIQHSYLHLVKAAMQEWSSLQNQSLIEENKRLKERLDAAELVMSSFPRSVLEDQAGEDYLNYENIISPVNRE